MTPLFNRAEKKGDCSLGSDQTHSASGHGVGMLEQKWASMFENRPRGVCAHYKITLLQTTDESMNNVFKLLIMVVGALLLPIGVHAAGPGPAGIVGDAAAGEGKIAVCAACHGNDGNSPMPTFPKLAGLGEKYLTKQLKDVKSGDRPIIEMTGLLDNMSDQDLADIAAFYSQQPMQLSGAKPLKVKLNSGIETDGLELGEKVYRAGNATVGAPACTGCHSPRGLGNAPAGYPRLSGQHADYIEKQLKAFRAGDRVNDGDAKTMRQVAEHLSDAEIKAVANFIAGLN